MMMKKLLSQRLFNLSKMASQGLVNCRISSSSLAVRTRVPRDSGEATIDPEPDDLSNSRRFSHQTAVNRNLKTPICERLMEKLREMNSSKYRIRLDGLSPPPMTMIKSTAEKMVEKKEEAMGITVHDAKKLLRAAQIEVVKTKLMEIGETWIPYSDFVRVCVDFSLDPVQGAWIAKMLDDSGNVIVLGNSVCLRPDQEIPKTSRPASSGDKEEHFLWRDHNS